MGGIEIFIGLAFLFAGWIKGAVGVGLPTVVMGLMSLVLAPAQAAPLMIIPAIGTNIWQMTAGPALGALARRLSLMILGIFVGTFSTVGLMTRGGAFAPAALGAVLAAYGAYGLFGRRFEVRPSSEPWVSPIVGLVTGMLSGATGVFVVPTVPYLTSLRINAEELVQAIGISAFVCPLALGLALATHGQYKADVAGGAFLALIPALLGMYLGQKLRRRLAAATFMRWFFAALIALGGYMFARVALTF